MARAKPTVARRQLGLTLRRLREQARRSQVQTGNAIGRTAARISQVETGAGSLSADDLTALLDFFGVEGEERKTVLSIGTEARRRSRRAPYTDSLPGSFQRLADLEADAVEICSYEAGIVPGLLQSPDYARATIRSCDGMWWEESEQEIEDRIAFRQKRQRRVFDAEASKRLSFVFTEDTLEHEMGGPSVMRGQILHILQLMEKLPNLSVRVILSETKNNPLLGGGIIVLGYSDAPSIGCATVVFGPCTYHDDEDDTQALKRGFRRASELALNVQDSRELLVRQLKESWT
ncbi:XRE family transcriptional regulator [Nocardiopsis gilva YIM 90087]|uniref:XRE family transcriptional regulator n=1 Tax=Nocardiopsis gilva YIM 90087 TaxID=1235441 RepID=A0A223S7B6_9ACTN|nr:helix-turn-helix transcriptional regulator [Nocardiopsis gilva]ASU84016.1 XRE family transcriptional regulator [Nocardiopsis gilva YIM 90087]